MKRIGLMGCGVVADYGHAPAIANTPGLELTSVYDPNPVAARRMQSRFPWTRAFDQLEPFLASGIDAVTVTSPAPAHASNVAAAAAHGLHVLCEKPLATSEEEADRMIATMDDAGLMLGVAFCYRFSSVAQRIREMVEQRWIGDVRAMRLIYVWNLHGKWESDGNGGAVESPRRIGRFLEGGPLVDCGVHQIDLARWWTGSEVARFRAAGAWVEEHETPGHVWLHMDHENGCHTAVEVSFSYCQTARDPVDLFTYELIGTDGLIRYVRDGWRFEVRNSRGTEFLPGGSEKDFGAMYAAWRDALEAGTLGAVPHPRDGQVATRIATRATEEILRDHRRK